MLKKLFHWVFQKEINDLEKSIRRCDALTKRLSEILGAIDVSVDVNLNEKYRATNWAVISIQGKGNCFIKFIDNIAYRDIMEISKFLRHFENVKVDAPPQMSTFIMTEQRKYKTKN